MLDADWIREGAPCFERSGGRTVQTTIARVTGKWVVLGNGSKYSRADMVKVGERGRMWVGGASASRVVDFDAELRNRRWRAVVGAIRSVRSLDDPFRTGSMDPVEALDAMQAAVDKARLEFAKVDEIANDRII